MSDERFEALRDALRRLASYEDMAEVEWRGEPPNVALASVEAQVRRLAEAMLRHHNNASDDVGKVSRDWQNGAHVSSFCSVCRAALTPQEPVS